jgi:hypothetical protein
MTILKFKFKEEIPNHKLKEVWNSEFKDKPFPNDIRAFILTTKHFIKTMNTIEKSGHGHDTSEQEYGEKLLPHQSAGFTRLRSDDDNDTNTLIFIRDNAPDRNETLIHELTHIYNTDKEKW